MKISKTKFDGLLLVEPNIHRDARGHFFESYVEREFKQFGVDIRFVQDNQSRSVKNVIRGLHFQQEPHAQTKLVRVLNGKILDVVVDLRVQQPTFGQVFSCELSAETGLQLLVPKGFAHGFSTLSDSADILYKCDVYYHPDAATGILYNDPALGIDWKVNQGEAILSEKDRELPLLNEWIRKSGKS